MAWHTEPRPKRLHPGPLLTDRGTDLHRYMSRILLEPQLQLEHTFLGCK